MKENKNRDTLINIPKRSFIEVTLLLLFLMTLSIVLTYIVPRGEFGVLPDGSTDYTNYIHRDDLSGIPLVKGIFAPVLVYFSGDGLKLIILSVFLLVISSSFQAMNDAGGIKVLVETVSARFRNHQKLFLVMITFLFYCFGSFLGLFEEMLTMLPIVTALCIFMGYDSFTGFICSILACGFGFAGAITNPFTVLLASRIIGADPMKNIWFRILIFIVMLLLLLSFLFIYLRKIQKDPSSSLTLESDKTVRQSSASSDYIGKIAGQNKKRILISYTLFLSVAFILIITSSAVPSLRDYNVVILILYFLIFGLITGTVASGSFKKSIRSYLRGLVSTLPTIVFISVAASVKYILEQGAILPTITNLINVSIDGQNTIIIALQIYLIVLLLEFFISSSSAKAILVMGFLALLNTGLSEQMLVLLYTFGDGYTNVLFPTSPVLLIALSMIGVKYSTWIRKSAALFAVNFALVVIFIIAGVLTGY